MGASSDSDFEFSRFRAVPEQPPVVIPATPSYRLRREPLTRYVVLFVLTLLSTTQVGGTHWFFFVTAFGERPVIPIASLLLHGLWYSASILAILGCHELGHYFACRYYRVDASRPYFLPVPLPLTGTLGAFIRIRAPIPGKRALFDIGIAGPIAGFLVAVPVLLIGMHLSNVVKIPETFPGGEVIELGEPLLFKAAEWLTFGNIPDGYSVNMHPMAFAAWFGMLATALNLFPIGQLDGGHISYAVLGRRSTMVTLIMVPCLIGLSFVSTSWIVWTVLTVGMLLLFGPRHPRVIDEEIPLDRSRLWLAAFALLMFVLCFTPAPIQPAALVGRH
jgi:membrane-associated protease RseP (regulator of RpoE activity)